MPRKPTGRGHRAARPPVRTRILEAALALLREGGIQRLTQIQAAARAGVRQSHITYYFPTRHDLLEAATLWFVDTLVGGLGRMIADRKAHEVGDMLAELAKLVAEEGHMRMFLGLVVEADGDPALRAMMVRGTQRLEASLAQALADGDRTDRARALLAAVWGLGLYAFLIQPSSRNAPTARLLAWLETGLPQPTR